MADRTPTSHRSHARTPDTPGADLSSSSWSESHIEKATRVRIKQIQKSVEQQRPDMNEVRSRQAQLNIMRDWSIKELGKYQQSHPSHATPLTSTSPVLFSYPDLLKVKQFVIKQLEQSGHEKCVQLILAEPRHSSPLIDQCLDLAPISISLRDYNSILETLENLESIPWIENHTEYKKFSEFVTSLPGRMIDQRKNIYGILVQALTEYLRKQDGTQPLAIGSQKNISLTQHTLEGFLRKTRIALGIEQGKLDKKEVFEVAVFSKELYRYIPEDKGLLITCLTRILRNHLQ
jgi:hypothetical protein